MILQTPICEPSHKIPYDISTDYKRLKELLDANYIIVAVTPMNSFSVLMKVDADYYSVNGNLIEAKDFERRCTNLEVAFINPMVRIANTPRVLKDI